jgi:glycosyltransferase involved in cell wall biosynthesis
MESTPSERPVGLCFKTGSFSLVNDHLEAALPAALPEYDLCWIEVLQILRRRPALHLLAVTEAVSRYGSLMMKMKCPPRPFVPRTSGFIKALRSWMKRDELFPRVAFTFQTQSVFRAARPGLPHFVYTDHTYLANLRYPQPKPLMPSSDLWKAEEEALYQDATVNFTSSEFAARSLVEDYGIPQERVSCVFSGVNLPFPAVLDPARRPGLRIVFVGVDWERKGGPDLLEAFHLVSPEFPEAELHIVGCSPSAKGSRIHIHGRIPPEAVVSHLESASIFCMPSRVEPAAVALVEASAYGLPVVSTAVGGNVERVVNGKTGLLVEPGNIAQLADALRKLLADAALREELGRQGRDFALQHFTWPAVCGKLAQRLRAALPQ